MGPNDIFYDDWFGEIGGNLPENLEDVVFG